jgi:hypothetical protein
MLCFLFAFSVGGNVVQGKLHCYYFCCVVLGMFVLLMLLADID